MDNMNYNLMNVDELKKLKRQHWNEYQKINTMILRKNKNIYFLDKFPDYRLDELIKNRGGYPIIMEVGLANEKYRNSFTINSSYELSISLEGYRMEINNKLDFMVMFENKTEDEEFIVTGFESLETLSKKIKSYPITVQATYDNGSFSGRVTYDDADMFVVQMHHFFDVPDVGYILVYDGENLIKCTRETNG